MRTSARGGPATGDRGVRSVIAVSAISIGLGASIGFTFGIIATALIDDLGLTRAAAGLLTSVYFGSTGVGSIAGGRVTERIGARLSVAVDLGIVAICAAVIVAMPTFPVLLVASALAGAAYSLANAGTNVAISATVPLERRAMAMTIKTAGVPGFGVVSAFAAPWAVTRFGWPVVMAAIAVLALVSTVVTMVVLPPDRAEHGGARSGNAPLPAGFLWFPLGSFFLLAGSQPLFSWIVPFFEESVGVSPTTAGRAAALATGGAIVIMLLLARRSDHRGAARRVRTMALLTAASALGVVVAAAGTWLGLWVGMAGALLGLGAQLGVIGNLHAAIADRAPGAVARASGVTMTGYYLGALAAPVTFGFLVDLSGGYTVPWAVMVAALVASAACFRLGDRVVPAGQSSVLVRP